MVLDHLIRLKHVAPNLTAERNVALLPSELFELGLLLLHLQIEQARLQHLHRLRSVLVLGPLVLTRDDDARGQMRDAHSGGGDVDVLTTGTTRSIRIDAEILIFDRNVDVFRQFRPHEDRRERRVAPRRLIERRDPHETMHACFGRHEAIGVIAGDGEGRALDTCFLTGLVVDDVALESAPLCPLEIHTEEHLRPVLRLGAARSRVNRHDGVGAVVLAAQHLLRLGGFNFLSQVGEAVRKICQLFSRRRPFVEHDEIVHPTTKRSQQREVIFHTPAALHDFLCFGLIAPEGGIGYGLLDVGELILRAGTLKDASADPSRAVSSRRTAVRDRRVPPKSLQSGASSRRCYCRRGRKVTSATSVNTIAAYAATSPTRAYTVRVVRNRTSSTIPTCSKIPDRATTRPYGSTTPLIPVFAARARYRPCSTARIDASSKCWYGADECPYHPSLVTVVSSSLPMFTASRTRWGNTTS